MKRFLVLVIGSVALLLCGLTADRSDGDLRQFQGIWRAKSVVNEEGEATPPKDLELIRLEVTGDRFVLSGRDFSIGGRITIDPAASPKTIDVLLDSGPRETPLWLLGIYRIEGDTRTSCFALPGKSRPTGFVDEPRGYFQFEWKRVSSRQ